MGAWGPTPLENDVAADWVGDLLADAVDGGAVAAALQTVGEEALAAAEVVAAACGHPAPGTGADVVAWAGRHRELAGCRPAAELCVRRVLAGSELRVLWDDDPAAFEAAAADLLERLGRRPRAPDERDASPTVAAAAPCTTVGDVFVIDLDRGGCVVGQVIDEHELLGCLIAIFGPVEDPGDAVGLLGGEPELIGHTYDTPHEAGWLTVDRALPAVVGRPATRTGAYAVVDYRGTSRQDPSAHFRDALPAVSFASGTFDDAVGFYFDGRTDDVPPARLADVEALEFPRYRRATAAHLAAVGAP